MYSGFQYIIPVWVTDTVFVLHRHCCLFADFYLVFRHFKLSECSEAVSLVSFHLRRGWFSFLFFFFNTFGEENAPIFFTQRPKRCGISVRIILYSKWFFFFFFEILNCSPLDHFFFLRIFRPVTLYLINFSKTFLNN